MIKSFKKPWKTIDGNVCYAGRPEGHPANVLDIETIETWLRSQRVSFGIAQETEHLIFAAVDRTRSYPIFYCQTDSNFHYADHPDRLTQHTTTRHGNAEAIAFYLESGYCGGKDTLINDVKQLEAGEYLIWDKNRKTLIVKAYYHYTPRFPGETQTRDYREELENALDSATKRVIAQAGGREIWVPLSGGLDSRAVLAKLVEHGCKDIQTFSYGSKGNTDCETARDIAGTLNIPWQYLEPSYENQKEFFQSDEAINFIKEASRYCSGPSFTDFFALKSLSDKGLIGPHSLLVNGQSGDYLTGGHLPIISRGEHTQHHLNDFFISKHFNLWNSLHPIKEHLCQRFIDEQHARFEAITNIEDNYYALYSFFSWLEWRERQSKYVVACQVNYDYFDCDWAMPLWDSDLMDLYEDLPFDLFMEQGLYINYLQSWNYKNLFSFVRRPVDPWPRNRLTALTIGRAAGLIGGKVSKERMYKFMRYWSTQDVHYKLMPLSAWLQIWDDIRNAEGFYALAGLSAMNLDVEWPPELKCAENLIDKYRAIML